jgi:acid phosphatase family membrane protein YuiD
VTSVTTAIGIKYWIFNELFAACLVFSMIIIYDAINVRFEAWLHAKVLNELTGKQYNFNESIWHLPKEALVWSIIWIISAFILMLI